MRGIFFSPWLHQARAWSHFALRAFAYIPNSSPRPGWFQTGQVFQRQSADRSRTHFCGCALFFPRAENTAFNRLLQVRVFAHRCPPLTAPKTGYRGCRRTGVNRGAPLLAAYATGDARRNLHFSNGKITLGVSVRL